MKLRPYIATAATLVLLIPVGCASATESSSRQLRFTTPLHTTIDYAVDGDTLRVSLPGGTLSYVRLVGIDTPEDVRPGYPTECGARSAAVSMRQLAPDGATVLLRPDSVAASRDRYGRILAHGFIKGRQLELAQLRRGWADVYRYDNQRFDGLAAFEAAERHARRAKLGVWGECDGDFHSAEPGEQN